MCVLGRGVAEWLSKGLRGYHRLGEVLEVLRFMEDDRNTERVYIVKIGNHGELGVLPRKLLQPCHKAGLQGQS